MRVLLIDNKDSFTYMLGDYIVQCGAICDVLRPGQITETTMYDAMVVSPGPGRPEHAPGLMPLLKELMEKMPVLGICLGHQAIGELMGANLDKAMLPRHGKVDRITHHGDPIFEGIPEVFMATRYHSLALRQLQAPLHIIAHADDGEIMGIRHDYLPIWGIQFHPESCETRDGLRLIKNYLSLAAHIA